MSLHEASLSWSGATNGHAYEVEKSSDGTTWTAASFEGGALLPTVADTNLKMAGPE